MDTMRDRFVAVTTDLLDTDPHTAVVLADIGVGRFADEGAIDRHPDRIINVGIREQAMVGVAAGFALSGLRPIVHTYAPFLIERPFEQLKLDLSHQDLPAVLVSVGASWDAASSGRTHQAPGDVAAVATLPGWTAYVPGHPDEVEASLRRAVASGGRSYIRLASDSNRSPFSDAVDGGVVVVRPASTGSPTLLVVGPLLDEALAAADGYDVGVVYAVSPHPLNRRAVRESITADDILVVEPYLEGTTAVALTAALADRPIRLRSLGVPNREFRRYGTGSDHRKAHGLDATGIRRALEDFLTAPQMGSYGCSARYRWMS